MANFFLTDKDKSALEGQIGTKSDKGHKHTAEDIGSGVMDIEHGGTGAKTAEEAKENLGCLKTEIKTYVGDGKFGSSNPNKLTFSFAPKIIYIQESAAGNGGHGGLFFIEAGTYCATTGYSTGPVSISENTVSWYSVHSAQDAGAKAAAQLNRDGTTYCCFAIG